MLSGVHRSNILPAASSLIFNRFTIAAIALVYRRSKWVRSSGSVQRMHLKQIFASSSPPRNCSGFMFLDVHRLNIRLGALPLIFNRFTIAATALVYWRSKQVCSSGCVRLMHLKQIFASSSPLSNCIGVILVGVHCSKIWPAASPLICYRFTVAAIALVYWRSIRVCSSGCVRRTHLKQIFASFSPLRKFI